VRLDEAKLRALSPDCDAAEIARHLDTLARVAAGEPDAGPMARAEQSERFHWLVAPSSTVVQPSPVHTGLAEDPQVALDALFDKLVA